RLAAQVGTPRALLGLEGTFRPCQLRPGIGLIAPGAVHCLQG
ncbi:hypothetical protein A2U01_0098723, partial [Trifolium medium]|nr:hypothetical protein [Trifolium medium]